MVETKKKNRPHVECRLCGNGEMTFVKADSLEKTKTAMSVPKGEKLYFKCEDCGTPQTVWSIPL
jgi:ribosomal protein S27E